MKTIVDILAALLGPDAHRLDGLPIETLEAILRHARAAALSCIP